MNNGIARVTEPLIWAANLQCDSWIFATPERSAGQGPLARTASLCVLAAAAGARPANPHFPSTWRALPKLDLGFPLSGDGH